MGQPQIDADADRDRADPSDRECGTAVHVLTVRTNQRWIGLLVRDQRPYDQRGRPNSEHESGDHARYAGLDDVIHGLDARTVRL